jgi:hypothetical protein
MENNPHVDKATNLKTIFKHFYDMFYVVSFIRNELCHKPKATLVTPQMANTLRIGATV